MKNTNVKNPIYFSEAILYKISDGFIEYNVTRKAHISAYVRVSGMNIHTLKELRKVMGEIDAPTPVPGIDHSHRTIGAAVTANLKLDSSGAVSAIEITEVNFRPVIGISWKGNDISTEYQDIAETFERIGAIAVFLPQLTSAHDAQAVLTAVDGIFMTGGSDLNPKLYGDQQTPHGSHSWNDVRDTSDFNLIRQAISLDVPMLCACRGLQVLNVVLGGALIQDIPYYLGQKVLEGEIDVDRVTKVLCLAAMNTLRILVTLCIMRTMKLLAIHIPATIRKPIWKEAAVKKDIFAFRLMVSYTAAVTVITALA